jgi:hypothetical protein
VTGDGGSQVFIVTADGKVSRGLAYGGHPEWSPDGRLIALDGIYTINAAGNDRQVLADTWTSERPAWQPLQPPPPPAAGYPRPRGATPLVVPLVPAFEQCPTSAQNVNHGPPLAFPSCKPPHQVSTYLTTGTPDANGAQAALVGFVRLDAIPGDPSTDANEADVAMSVSLTDVRCRFGGSPWCTQDAPMAPYLGEISTVATLQMTDRDSGGTAGDPVTFSPTSPVAGLPFVVQCAPTGDSTVGSTCEGSTTANAITPGTVQEGERAVWELGAVQVFDGGNNGMVDDDGVERVFADQGLFVP